jgi:hypothetical protein
VCAPNDILHNLVRACARRKKERRGKKERKSFRLETRMHSVGTRLAE